VYAEPYLAVEILRYHGLFDAPRFGPLPVLTVAAILWACRADRVARVTALALLVNFAATYATGMPSPGVEFAQRLGVFAIGVLLVAMAGARALEGWVGESRRTFAALLAAAGLLVTPPLFPGWRTLATLTPVHREYLAVESAAAAIPREVTLVHLRTAEETLQGNFRYAGLLMRMGKKIRLAPPEAVATMPPPWLFLETIECWAYSFRELTGVTDENAERDRFGYRWDRVLFGQERSPLRPPPGPRPVCLPYLAGGNDIGPRTLVDVPDDDPPFLFYSADTVPVGFHELRAPVTQ